MNHKIPGKNGKINRPEAAVRPDLDCLVGFGSDLFTVTATVTVTVRSFVSTIGTGVVHWKWDTF